MSKNMLVLKTSIFLLLSIMSSLPVINGADNDCTKSLGLSNSIKTILDADITASVSPNDAAKARLNNPSGAWCFSLLQEQGVEYASLTVNLKQPRFITGILTQGPPTSTLPASYFATANMEIDFSDDGSKWTSCCPDTSPRQFLVTDDAQSSDKIQTHSLGEKVGLIRTQYVRFKFKVNMILLASNPESVCFRFEVIGCPTDFLPVVTLTSFNQPSGFLDLAWSRPRIKIFSTATASATVIEQEVAANSYTVRYTAGNPSSSNNATEVKTLAARYSLPLPQWGVTYKFVVLCVLQGEPVQCGSSDVQAMLETDEKKREIVTSGPTAGMTAHAVADSSVILNWSYTDSGWVPPRYSVGLAGINGAQEIPRSATNVKFSGLSPALTYVVQFRPILSGFGDPPLVFNGTLNFMNITLRKSQLVKAEAANLFGNQAALMGAPNFRMTPLWSGRMRMSWQPAMAYMLDTANESSSVSVPILTYAVSLIELVNTTSITGGNNTERVTFPFTTSNNVTRLTNRTITIRLNSINGTISHDFPGIRIDTDYVSTLACSLDGTVFVACGRSSVRTRAPTSVITNGTSGKNSSIYDRKLTRMAWGAAEAVCQQEGGHLISLGTSEKESLLESTLPTNITEFWLGASVCVNRTATTIWTDASPYSYFPLHSQTGLSRAECCLKIQREPNSAAGRFGWYADQCGFPNFAICESKADALISDFASVSLIKNPNNSISIFWDTTGTNWDPSSARVQFCRAEDFKPSAPFVPPSQMKACLNFTTTTASAEALAMSTFRPNNGTSMIAAGNLMNVTGLEDFVRYDVKVHGIVKGVVAAGPVWQLKLTTDPIKPVYSYITPEGITTLTWATFVQEGKPDAPIKITYKIEGEAEDPVKTLTGTATMTKLGRLKYGATYVANLMEDAPTGRNETFKFKAMPMCTSPESQSGKTCFWARQRLALYTDTFAMCRERSGGGLAVLYNNDEERLAASLSAKLKQDLWIVERTLRKKRDLEIVMQEDDSADFEVIGPSANNTCWYIGALSAQREEIADCKSTRKFPLCHRSVAARTGMPIRQSGELNTFDIQRYPKAARISWPWDSSSWLARFNVSLTKIIPPPSFNGSSGAMRSASYTMARMKRSVDAGLVEEIGGGAQLITKQFTQPPVVIEGLDEGFVYSADITADFGGPAREFSGSFTVPGEVNVDDLSTNKTMEIIWMLVNGIMVALTTIAIVAFLASGTFFLDAIFQMGMLLSLLVAHLVLLIRPPYQFLGTCEPLAHLLHFLFLSACANLASEAATVTLRFRDPNKMYSLKTKFLFVLLTWAVPALLTLIMAGVKRSPGLVDHSIPICWLYLDGSSFYFWWSVIPITAFLTFVIACAVVNMCLYNNAGNPNALVSNNADADYNNDERQMRRKSELRWVNGLATQFDGTERHETYATTRWSLAIIASLLGITWALGVGTIHAYNNNAARVAFLIFALFLGAAIFVFRVVQDRHIRRGLGRNCCNIRQQPSFLDGNKTKVRPMMLGSTNKKGPFMTGASRIGLKRLTESAYPDEYATRPNQAGYENAQNGGKKLPAPIPVNNPMPNFMSAEPGPNEYVLFRKSYNFN